MLMDYVQHRSDKRFVIRLDQKKYDESTLIEIRVPVDLPYQTDWKEFERVDGEINLNGAHYKYVERKLEAGVMIYKCIQDKGKGRIVNARENFFKLVNDLETDPDRPPGKQLPPSGKTFSFDFCEHLSNWSLDQLQPEQANFLYTISASPLAAYLRSPEQPPDCIV